MNPIEYLKQNGYNPDNFRTVPLQVGVNVRDEYYNPKPVERAKVALPGVKAVAAYMQSRGLENVSCRGIEPILPFLIADSFMLLDEEYLKGYAFTEEEKHFRDRLMEHYWEFNHSLYKCLDDETKSELADIVEEFSDYISHDLDVFRYAIVGPIMHADKGFRETYSVLAAARMYGMAVHYYDEENIEIRKTPAGTKVSAGTKVPSKTTKVKLTKAEEEEARKKALNDIYEAERKRLLAKPKKTKTEELQPMLFDF